MKKNYKNTGGITLVALVITIILLLILAGVAIATLNGDNGLITRTKEAKTKTEQSNIEETKKLTQIEASMNEEKTTYTYTVTENGEEKIKTVPIPAECAVSQVEGENTVENGLVIIDKNGNEWVWIPCTTENEYKTADSGWVNGGYSDKTWADTQATGTGTTSVSSNGGFFISRYEAGIPEDMTGVYVNKDVLSYTKNDDKNVTAYTPVSKKGVQAWNFISQTNSKTVAEKMLSNDTVQSYLVDSYAWNAICRKIDSKYGITKSIANSTIWGNYYNNTTTEYEKINTLFATHTYNSGWTYATTYSKGNVTGAPKNYGTNRLELATGASEDFKAYNVYDIAGNMWEWTTETSTNGYAVLRGGSFNAGGSVFPAVVRYGNFGTGYYNVNIGFRAVLYIK